MTTEWIPKKLIKYPAAVQDRASKVPTMWQLLGEERARLEEEKRCAIDAHLSFRINYRLSPQWQSIRRAVFARARGVCEGCHSAPCTQGHHLTYEREGNERLEDILAVCRPCHEAIHGIGRKEAV